MGHRPVGHSPEKHARSRAVFAPAFTNQRFFITTDGPQAHGQSRWSQLGIGIICLQLLTEP